MADANQNVNSTAAQRPPAALTGPFLEFDLTAEIELLRREAAYQRGRNSKTLAKHPDLRVVLVAIQHGERIREHTSVSRITVETVAGHIRMHVQDRLLDMPGGRLLVLDCGIPHDVEAVTDSAFLITFAWRNDALHP